MVIPRGLEGLVVAVRRGEEQISPGADLTDRVKRNAAMPSWDLRRLLSWNGEEEFVIFPAVEGKIQGVGGAQIIAGRGTRDSLRPDACAHPAGLTEARKIFRKAIAQIDKRGGQLLLHQKPAEGAAGLWKEVDLDGIDIILYWLGSQPANLAEVRGSGSRPQASETQRGNAQPATHKELIACPGSGPADCLPPLDFSHQEDIDGGVSGNYGGVPAHYGDPVALGKRKDACVKLLQPGVLCSLGNGQRNQRVARRSAHRCDVTERAGERAMAHSAGRMEVAQEMHSLDGEVGGQYELVPAANLHQRGIVANPQAQSLTPALSQLLEPSDKFILGLKHAAP